MGRGRQSYAAWAAACSDPTAALIDPFLSDNPLQRKSGRVSLPPSVPPRQIREASEHFTDVSGWTSDKVALQIASDRIHVSPPRSQGALEWAPFACTDRRKTPTANCARAAQALPSFFAMEGLEGRHSSRGPGCQLHVCMCVRWGTMPPLSASPRLLNRRGLWKETGCRR